MNDQQHSDPAIRLKEMEEENELLLLQLHQVQEELERYYLRNQELEKGLGTGSVDVKWVDDALPEALAEARRLRDIVAAHNEMRQIEAQNSLHARLADALIKAVDTPGGLLQAPAKLIKLWRHYSQQTPPAALGGKGYERVIAAYDQGGLPEVEKLLTSQDFSPVIQANAYTALARHLGSHNVADAAEAARRAHAIDPRPYRLKWLAFRLHDAGNALEADALLDVLPPSTQFSDSESRQVGQIRYEAKQARLREARQQIQFSEKRAEFERQLKTLKQERNAQTQLAAERQSLLDALRLEKNTLEREKSALTAKLDEQTKLAAQRQQEIEALKEAEAQLEEQKAALEAQREELTAAAAERQLQLEALQQARAQLEEEKAALAAQLDEQTQLAAQRQQEVEALKAAQAKLEQEKSALTAKLDEQTKLAAERLKQINELQQQLQGRQASEAELSARQQLMQEELLRAEAQIDLIKDLLLREPAL